MKGFPFARAEGEITRKVKYGVINFPLDQYPCTVIGDDGRSVMNERMKGINERVEGINDEGKTTEGNGLFTLGGTASLVGKEPSDMNEIGQQDHSDDIIQVQPAPTMSHSPNSITVSDSPQLIDYPGDGDEDDLLIPSRPKKSQVLHYFAKAHNFVIHRLEGDVQITDNDGFPLFDAFVDPDCIGTKWILESYGKSVLFMREYKRRILGARIRVVVRDWNGGLIGEFLPGDNVCYIHNAQGKLVAKLLRQNANCSSSDHSKTSDESGEALTPLTLPLTPPGNGKPTCWVCIEEETGRHCARMEDLEKVQFTDDAPFQLRLLVLAAIIRLVGHGSLNASRNCLDTVKMVLNCCIAY